MILLVLFSKPILERATIYKNLPIPAIPTLWGVCNQQIVEEGFRKAEFRTRALLVKFPTLQVIPFVINNFYNSRCLLPARLRLHSGQLVQVGASLQLLWCSGRIHCAIVNIIYDKWYY
jgi:hypothetical protein